MNGMTSLPARHTYCVRFVVLILVFLLGGMLAEAGRPSRPKRIVRLVSGLKKSCPKVCVRDKHISADVAWVEIDVYDENVPMTLDVVVAPGTRPRRIIYLLTASSLNFRSSFFAPIADGLAFYLAKQGYIVIGITPREDNVSLDADDSIMARWGMAKHRRDIHKMIVFCQRVLHLPYDILGHSFGGMCALDYAAKYSNPSFGSVLVLETPSINPKTDPTKAFYAELSIGAYKQLMEEGVYADSSIDDLRALLLGATLSPFADSGQPRPLGDESTFTLSGLAHFVLIFTGFLDGAITPYTGLPQEWPMLQGDFLSEPRGNMAGSYVFASDPVDDMFGLYNTDLSRMAEAALELGSGLTPLALARDYTAAIVDNSRYPINWAGIDERVVWINGAWSMGAQTFGAEEIEAAGNTNVTVRVVPRYGHTDVIYSDTAAEDVWQYLLP